MRDVLNPTWGNVQPCLTNIQSALANDDTLVRKAFLGVTKHQYSADTFDDVVSHLRGVVTMPGVPWLLFDTISALVVGLPAAMRRQITSAARIPTGASGEWIQVTTDGRWQAAWELGTSVDEDGSVPALDLYRPVEREKAPIVPLEVLDYVGAAVALMRDGLILPAGAVLLTALESSLWDHLATKVSGRAVDRITYASVRWKYKLLGGKLLITVDGADQPLLPGNHSVDAAFREGEFVAQITGGAGGSAAALRLESAAELIPFLATMTEATRESVSEKGLAEAIQRARSIGSLKTIPVQLDEPLYRLRNALAHLPMSGQIAPPIPNPNGGEIRDLRELRQDPRFISSLLYPVVSLINELYAQ